MVWSIALANILGSGLCFLFSGQFARLATLRYTLIMPVVLGLIYIGAYEGKRDWGDLITLLVFGLLGWTMKHAKWQRPPLILGLILGGILERYLFTSVERYGWSGWVTRPVVLVVLAVAIVGLLRSFIQDIRERGGLGALVTGFTRPHFAVGNLFPVFLICLMGWMVLQALGWDFDAKIGPLAVGGAALLFCTMSLLNDVFRAPVGKSVGAARVHGGGVEDTQSNASSGATKQLHMDIPSAISHLSAGTVLFRGLIFFGWMLGFMGSMALIGLIPTLPIFIVSYMRIEGRERWRLVLPITLLTTAFIYVLFDRLLAVPWPPTVLGAFFPVLKAFVPSL
jgi:hypothetical protein